jgi:hypothetical protein
VIPTKPILQEVHNINAEILATARSSTPDVNEPRKPSSPQNAKISMANSNLESILVETPGNFHDLETTSVLPKNISVFLRGGHLRDKIQLRGSSLQLEKNIHYEGFLAALVGSKQSTPCNYCSANDGPWAVCIAGRDADGDPLEGACAGCHYDGRGLECSFRGQFISRLS